MINAAIIGFGSIAKSAHLDPYLQLEKEGLVKLTAVCDICPEQFHSKAHINIGSSDTIANDSIRKYTDWREMLRKEKIDMVDICLPTYLHSPVAVEALKTGHHVLCEKPMSLNSSLCEEMLNASRESGKKLMIGQCLRFDKRYSFLKQVIDENTFGPVKTGVFFRLSAPPLWGYENWFLDYEKSRGCITDMHIHDIDMIRYLFGEPQSVSCHTQDAYGKKDIAHSTLCYPDFTMLALGDWSQEGLPFSAGFRISFETATIDCQGQNLTVYPRGESAYNVELSENNSYYAEIKFFVESIINDTINTVNPPESAALSVKLVNTLIESSDKNGACITII